MVLKNEELTIFEDPPTLTFWSLFCIKHTEGVVSPTTTNKIQQQLLFGGFPGTWLDDFPIQLESSSSRLIFFRGVEITNQIICFLFENRNCAD